MADIFLAPGVRTPFVKGGGARRRCSSGPSAASCPSRRIVIEVGRNG